MISEGDESLNSKRSSKPVKTGRHSPEGREREFPTTKVAKMGGADDRTYYGATPRCPPNPNAAPSRDFHYNVPDHFRSGSASSRQSRNSSSASSNYHSPHVTSSSSSRRSGSGRSTGAVPGPGGGAQEYYIDKSSPYHHGRRQQDYFLRQQVKLDQVSK